LLLSSTPGSGDLRNKFYNLPIPLSEWESDEQDSISTNLTGDTTSLSFVVNLMTDPVKFYIVREDL
jgi:hypothetical protein